MDFYRATRADIPAMAEIRLLVTENSLSDPMRITTQMYEDHLDSVGRGWVCKLDEQIVGFSYAAQADHSIWALFVRRGFERRGIATRLLALATDWLFAAGAERIVLSTAASTRADLFYQAQGWERGAMKNLVDVTFSLQRRAVPIR